MPVTRQFIGWHEPAPRAVRRFLLPERLDGPADLEGLLVVAPTREAGRRLRATLAAYCAERHSAVLSLRVVTPSFFMHPADPPPDLADESVVHAAWARTVASAAPGTYPALLPDDSAAQDLAWSARFVRPLLTLRQDLCEAGLAIADVPRRLEADLQEPERWQDLAALEKDAVAAVSELGLRDPVRFRLAFAARPPAPDAVERIVLAACPDLPRLARRVLEALAARLPVDVLVCAPPDTAERFDPWGQPLAAGWHHAPIEIPDPERHVLLAASPRMQSHAVLEQLREAAAHEPLSNAVIGVPDRSVVPFLTTDLAAEETPAFDPADLWLRDHPIYHLVDRFCTLAADQSYRAFSLFLRHPDVLACLGLPVDRLLTQLDRFQNEYLPWQFDECRECLQRHRRHNAEARDEFAELMTAADRTAELLTVYRRQPFEAALRHVLESVYRERMLDAASPDDEAFEQAAKQVDETLHEFGTDAFAALAIPNDDAARLFVQRLGAQRYHRERERSPIELLGWLELPWTDAPHLIVTGMNEGCVPDAPADDTFLPDPVRNRLGMPCDASRLARDAYLMRVCIETRRRAGRACFIAGKTSASGDPLKPSRLLFLCPDAELPARTARLFGPAAETRPAHAASISITLDPAAPLAGAPPPALDHISVTALRDYLACPFRFYLGRILRMEELDDRKGELDALDFGSLLHAALETLAHDAELAACDDAERLAARLASEAEETLKSRFGRRLSVPLLVALEAAVQRLKAAAVEQVRLTREGWDIIAGEQSFEMPCGPLLLRGKIDRIDRHRESGTLRLIDYKTSDSPVSPLKAHLAAPEEDTPDYARVTVAGKPRRWVDLQLPIYLHLYAARETRPASAELAYFNLPKAVTGTGLDAWGDLPASVLDAALRCAAEVARRIHAGVFWPPAERLRYDEYEWLAAGHSLAEACRPLPAPPAAGKEVSGHA